MKTRHVIVRGFGEHQPDRQGFVLTWRQVPRGASPPTWEAFVVSVRNDEPVIEWVNAVYLEPVVSERPA